MVMCWTWGLWTVLMYNLFIEIKTSCIHLIENCTAIPQMAYLEGYIRS